MFFKKNLNIILKTLGFNIVLSIFGTMMYMATLNSGKALTFIGTAIMFCCYCYLMYEPLWNLGGKDGVANPKRGFPLKGLSIAAIAFSPALICLIICLFIAPTDIQIDGVTVGYNWTWPLFQIAKLLFGGIYYSLANFFFEKQWSAQVLFLLITNLPGIIACTLGYCLGHRGISIKASLGLKNGKE